MTKFRGLLSIISCLTQTELFLIVIGVMFVVSAVSVILQVLFFKTTGKRIFLMAPFHHHLQHKGMNENRIVFIYICITIVVGLTCLLFI